MFGHSWVKRKGCTCFNLDMDVGTHSRTDFPPILHSFCNHINLVFPAKAKLLLTGQALALNPFISFLPLKHSFEHSLGTWVNVNGVISGRYWRLLWTFMGFPCSSVSKESACSAGDLGSIFGSGRSPGEGNGNPLHAFAWKIPRTEEPGGLHSMGSQRVGAWRTVGACSEKWWKWIWLGKTEEVRVCDPKKGAVGNSCRWQVCRESSSTGGLRWFLLQLRTNWRLMELLMELCSKGR